jgi:hypothetical protein
MKIPIIIPKDCEFEIININQKLKNMESYKSMNEVKNPVNEKIQKFANEITKAVIDQFDNPNETIDCFVQVRTNIILHIEFLKENAIRNIEVEQSKLKAYELLLNQL